MKKLLLLFIASGVFASCTKHDCGCEPSPTAFAFTIVDKDGRNAVNSTWVHNYKLYYLNSGNKTDLDLSYKDDLDSIYKYKYLFNSYGAQSLPDKGIHEFYINYGKEDTDTLWIETEQISKDWAYNIKTVKFNGEAMKIDSFGIYLLRK